MKVLILGDPHIGRSQKIGRQQGGNALNSRITDQMNLLDWTSDCAIREGCSRIIITGDIFDDPKPHPTFISLVISWLKKCSEHNIQVHIIQGNHDLIRSGAFNMSALDIIAAADLDGVIVHKDIDTIYDNGISFTVLPFRDRRSFDTMSNNEALNILSSKLPYEVKSMGGNDLKLLVGHLAIEGSIFVGDEIDDMANELFCPLTMFNGYDYVLNGHVHKPQVLSKSPYIGHIGSMDISDFGETGHKKVIAIIDPESPEPLRYLELPTRPLKQISISVPKHIVNATDYILTELQLLKLNNAITRLNIVFENTNTVNINRSIIEAQIYKAGAFHLSKIIEERKVAPIKNDAMHKIDNTVNETMAIKMYSDLNVEKEWQSDFISLANEIVNECIINRDN